MCTENGPADVTVCDVALPDVRSALDGLGVTFEHLPYEGTRVVGGADTATEAFRSRLDAALRPHGGGLRD
ncbi:MAG: hypothetical protein JWO60_2322 [Frankiales bacterium]|nr:hypothetical protein [Frankiales bacterium]